MPPPPPPPEPRPPLNVDRYAAFLHLDFTPDQAEQLARSNANPAVVGYRLADCHMTHEQALAIYT